MYFKITLSAFFILGCSVVLYLNRAHTVRDGIRIYFPLTVLKRGPELLDPSNTETVWEYYLLENLSCGLIRDSVKSPSGYEGCVSDQFFQEDLKTWVFHIRNIRWSDGAAVSAQEVTEWIRLLIYRESRHVKFLRHVKNFEFDEATRFLRLHFSVEVDDRILHELSLADAALMPTNYGINGWKKTIGPYAVDEWTGSNGTLKLTANVFSPLYSNEMPQSATLFWLDDPKQRVELFKSIEADVVPQTATANPFTLSRIRANAHQEYVAYPTSILFFYFNQQNEAALDVKNRELFASIIRNFQKSYHEKIKAAYGWDSETQMIPEGFSGRLKNNPEPNLTSRESLPSNLEISLFENFREFPEFTQGLISAFKDRGVSLTIKFSSATKLSHYTFASLYVFVGNQLDSTGSWAFLLSEPHGTISPWKNSFKREYDAVFNIAEISDRKKTLELLHSAILSKYLAVPVEVGSIKYFLSSRIDCKRWNKFDSRMRIYDLRERTML